MWSLNVPLYILYNAILIISRWPNIILNYMHVCISLSRHQNWIMTMFQYNFHGIWTFSRVIVRKKGNWQDYSLNRSLGNFGKPVVTKIQPHNNMNKLIAGSPKTFLYENRILVKEWRTILVHIIPCIAWYGIGIVTTFRSETNPGTFINYYAANTCVARLMLWRCVANY